MHQNHVTLFNNLVNLTKTTEVFYKQEYLRDGVAYWIFNYRLSSYSDFQLPDAKWARGIMFEVTPSGDFVRLASLPMSKFFNLGENPETIGLNLDEIAWIEVKSDGSLMSTYIHNGELYLKSKGSLYSEQAIDAMAWLDLPENSSLKGELSFYTHGEFTVNLEWVSPKNRIVLAYEEPKLIVLNIMDNVKVGYHETDAHDFSRLGDYMNQDVHIGSLSKKEFIEAVPAMQDNIEGFIFVMNDGQRVKVKTDKYISLHHAKDSVTNPRRLFECVLDEAVDDLKSMFATDPVSIKIIEQTEEKVKNLYNHCVASVESAYEKNKHMDRKDFAITSKAEVDPMFFGLVMNLYIGRSNDYKEFMKKRYKELGFIDTSVNKEE